MPGLSHSKCSINSCETGRGERERKRKEGKKNEKEGGRGEKTTKEVKK